MKPTSSLTVRLVALAACLVAGRPTPAAAISPTITKLTLPPSELAGEASFGTSVALNDVYVAVGDQNSNVIAPNGGAVHIFDARTGRYLRRLAPPTLSAPSNFGRCLAISGNILAVGAPNQQVAPAFNNHGTVYLFDLRTGRLLHELVDTDNLASSPNLGTSVAISGRWVAAGAPNFNSARGAVLVFDAITGELIHRLEAADGAPNENLGRSVAISGQIVVGGSHRHNLNSGAAYVFDALSGAQLQKLVPSDAAANMNFAESVAICGTTAWVGAYNTGAGAVYTYDLTLDGATTTEQNKIPSPDGAANDGFGNGIALSPWLGVVNARFHDAFGANSNSGALYLIDPASGGTFGKITATFRSSDAVALFGNTAVVSSDSDENRNGDGAGAAYLIRPVAGYLPLTSRATSGASAPGADSALFRGFGNAFINADENIALHGILTSNRGRDQGIWSDVNRITPAPPDLISKSGDALDTWSNGNTAPGAFLAGMRSLVMNQDEMGLFEGFLAGPGINRTNRNAIYAFSGGGSSYVELVRTGQPVLGNGEAPAFFYEFAQNRGSGATARFSLAYLLQRGLAGVDLTNDSGVLMGNDWGFSLEREVAREGQPAPVVGGGTYRQFFGRTAMNHPTTYAFPAYWTPTGETVPVQGMFADTAVGPGGSFARQGGNAAGFPGRQLGTFLAETMNTGGQTIFRATMTGPDVNRTNNMALWNENVGSLVAKGEAGGPVYGLPEGTIVNILSFWPVRDENTLEAIIALVQLAGPGINRTNDLSLMLLEDGQEAQVLLREGQQVADVDSPTIATIQRVDVDPVDGHYVVLAGLTGNRARNQALFTGQAGAADPGTRRILRAPTLRLRKGTSYQSRTGTSTGIRSIFLSPTTDRGGAGGRGLGQVINQNGRLVVTIQFDNGTVEVMTGQP
ncbi:MAG: hypothetical protein JNK37_25015 [Verrucomicrobiales bacterium]|nr:hypothetical protein [Verrucomicrobiales bacterium]